MNKFNQTQAILIRSMPGKIVSGITALSKTKEEADDVITRGLLVSEVGFASPLQTPAYDGTIMSYNLRQPRKNKVPSFIFGGAYFNDALTCWMPRTVTLPVAGSKITLNPELPKIAYDWMSAWNFKSYDVHWILSIPCPLGAAIYLKVFAPEQQTTVETRGVRWKPSGEAAIAVSCPYSNDISLVAKAAAADKVRKGQPGGSIVIETIEDNSATTVQSPMTMTVYCLVRNVCCTGWDPANAIFTASQPFEMQFRNNDPPPVPPPTGPTEYWEESDVAGTSTEAGSTEISAEGAKPLSETEVTPSIPLAPQGEKPITTPAPISKNVAKQKFDAGHLGAKWVDLQTITIDSAKIMQWQTVSFNPYTMNKKGESISNPLRRNVWATGTRARGYNTMYAIQVNITRSPQISGILEVKDSINDSSRMLVSFGEKAEMTIIPKVHNGVISTRPRDWNSPWIRTDQLTIELQYRLVAFNRTADVADTKVKISIRSGNTNYQGPRKPKKRPTPPTQQYLDNLTMFFSNPETDYWEESDVKLQDKMAIVDNRIFITPRAADTGEHEALHDELGEFEDIALNEFPIVIMDERVPTDEIIAVPLPLNALVDVDDDENEENAITQVFDRFGNVIPTKEGGWGPVVGSYTIEQNLPATFKGRIEHVALPGDCNTEIAIRIFGLSSILGLGSAALKAVGGPLLSGVLETVGGAVGGVASAIGGDALGGLVNGVLNIGKGILGMGGNEEQAQPPPPAPQAPNAISGEIPISRYLEFLRPIASNYEADPVWPTLLMKLADFIGYDGEPLEEIPIRILANMNHRKVERNIFNRLSDSSAGFIPEFFIIMDSVPGIMEAFLTHRSTFEEGTLQNLWFKRFMVALNVRMLQRAQDRKPIYLSELKRVDATLLGTAKSIFAKHRARVLHGPGKLLAPPCEPTSDEVDKPILCH